MEGLHVEYISEIWREGSQFVARAVPLDVASVGRSPDEAREALGEAVRLFLVTARDAGTLGNVLAESGYELRDGQWIGPSWIGTERRSAAIGAGV